MKKSRHIIKYSIGLLTVLFFRLVPHPPNVEPIMATMMPFAKKWGWLSGFVFVVLAMLTFDVITKTISVWSFLTIGTYALIAIGAGFYFRNRKNSLMNYVGFSIVGTLAYDAITGIGYGVFLFKQSLIVTIMAQIPFTVMHLAGNVVLAAIASPLLYRWVVDNKELELNKLVARLTSIVRS